MIKTEKEKHLLGIISKLFKGEIDEPKGIYLEEASDFGEEMEFNLYSLNEDNQKRYLARIIDRFNQWIDENDFKNVVSKPKTKREKNLRALVNTVEHTKSLIRNSLIRFLPKETEKQKLANEKIKWLGNIEQFGFIFGELASKGYIELPTKNGEGAFSKLAELSLMYFELTATKGKNAGKQTSIENLERSINPETNQLSMKGKAGLKFPPLKDLK